MEPKKYSNYGKCGMSDIFDATTNNAPAAYNHRSSASLATDDIVGARPKVYANKKTLLGPSNDFQSPIVKPQYVSINNIIGGPVGPTTSQDNNYQKAGLNTGDIAGAAPKKLYMTSNERKNQSMRGAGSLPPGRAAGTPNQQNERLSIGNDSYNPYTDQSYQNAQRSRSKPAQYEDSLDKMKKEMSETQMENVQFQKEMAKFYGMSPPPTRDIIMNPNLYAKPAMQEYQDINSYGGPDIKMTTGMRNDPTFQVNMQKFYNANPSDEGRVDEEQQLAANAARFFRGNTPAPGDQHYKALVKNAHKILAPKRQVNNNDAVLMKDPQFTKAMKNFFDVPPSRDGPVSNQDIQNLNYSNQRRASPTYIPSYPSGSEVYAKERSPDYGSNVYTNKYQAEAAKPMDRSSQRSPVSYGRSPDNDPDFQKNMAKFFGYGDEPSMQDQYQGIPAQRNSHSNIFGQQSPGQERKNPSLDYGKPYTNMQELNKKLNPYVTSNRQYGTLGIPPF